jgi:predicted nucleic acid-binding protein
VAPSRLFLDTCVLYPPSIRDLLLRLAIEDAFQIRISAGVLAELESALPRQAGLAPEVARAKVQAIRAVATSLGALTHTSLDTSTIGASLALPDPDDAHLVDAALAAKCDAIVSTNLKHLPEAQLERVGLEVWHPDWVVEEMAKHRHPALLRVVADLLEVVPRYERVSDIALVLANAGLQNTGGQILSASFATAVEQYDPAARRL